MNIASNAYLAQREATSRFEGSKKELSLKTKTTTTHRTETIKQTLSESGPESLLASHGKYARTHTFAVGQAKRAVLAFSEEKQRVDGFVVNKDQQLVPIKAHDLPKELRQILNSDAFDAFLNDVHARLTELSNGDFRLDINQGLKGGVYRANGNIVRIENELKKQSKQSWNGRHESRVIIENKCQNSLVLVNYGVIEGFFSDGAPENAFNSINERRVIPPIAAGGFLCDSKLGKPNGTRGYISMRIETDFGHFLVVCAFSTAFGLGKNNSARLTIRSINEYGNVEGHGIDQAGSITDENQYFSKMTYYNENAGNKKISKPGRTFDVHCKFNNKRKAYFIFTLKQKDTLLGQQIQFAEQLEEQNARLEKVENEQNQSAKQVEQFKEQVAEEIEKQNTRLEEVENVQTILTEDLLETIKQNQDVLKTTLAQNQNVINSNQAFLANLMDRLEKLS